mgnify:CR=1 FL=1
MNEILRLAHPVRCEAADPRHAVAHRLRIGFAVAALILILSPLRYPTKLVALEGDRPDRRNRDLRPPDAICVAVGREDIDRGGFHHAARPTKAISLP